MTSKQKLQFGLQYSPTLDGVRGLAVLAVMAVHAPLPYAQWGYLGVDVFFTLSGFLITTVLLQEWSESGSVDLKNFYARRALRLLPALSILLVVSLLPVNPLDWGERIKAALVALFYSSNWVRAFAPGFRMGGLGHTWSLSIEEQFYLLWPIALLAMLRFEGLRKRIALILGAGIGACMIYRLALWMAGRTPERLYNGLDTRADCLLTGCVLSVMLVFGMIRADFFTRGAVRLTALLIALPALVLVCRAEWNDPFMFMAGYSVVSVSSAVFILAVLSSSSSWLRTALTFGPLVGTGRISYGLYLWHYPVFGYVHTLGLPAPAALVVMYMGVFVVAGLSYYCVERPFLRMKQRFKAPANPPAGVLVATP